MKRNRVFALLLAFLFAAAMLTACGTSSQGGNGTMAADVNAAEESMPEENGLVDQEAAVVSLPQMPTEAKLIYTGHLTLETLELEPSYQALTGLVSQFGGFYEQQEMYNGGQYLSGSYTVRVPSDQFEAFLNAVAENQSFQLTYRSTFCENVSEAYGDIENRLETLQIKQDRLQALLEKAESMDDIIAIESELTEVEAELDVLSGEKKRYDNLIDYSTVYVELREVGTFSEGVNPSMAQRLSSGFHKGVQNFAEGVENLLVWFVSNLLLIAVVVLIIVIVVLVIQKKKKKKAKHVLPDAEQK